MRLLTKKMAISPSSTVHGGQHDTNYVAIELLMHAAVVADEIWGILPEPACRFFFGSNRAPFMASRQFSDYTIEQ